MSVAPLQFFVFAGWVNRVLREQLGGRRLRFTDAQRRRLAAKGKVLGRRVLHKLGGLVTPDTILRWYRELITTKYDGTARRTGGRSGTAASPHFGVIAATDFFTVEVPGMPRIGRMASCPPSRRERAKIESWHRTGSASCARPDARQEWEPPNASAFGREVVRRRAQSGRVAEV